LRFASTGHPRHPRQPCAAQLDVEDPAAEFRGEGLRAWPAEATTDEVKRKGSTSIFALAGH
jgi:hypothetical protein